MRTTRLSFDRDRIHCIHRRRVWLTVSMVGLVLCVLINSIRMIVVVPLDGSTFDLKQVETYSQEYLGRALATSTTMTTMKRNKPCYVYPDANVTRPLHNRPYFILHVGPPKTATTTIQLALGKYQRDHGVLSQDGYRYVGQFLNASQADMVNHHKHGQLLRSLKDLQCAKEVTESSRMQHRWPSCYHRIRRMLIDLRAMHQSIIVSEEMFSIPHVPVGNTTIKNGIPQAWDWPILADLLRATGFEPLALIGYRRLADILPSAHQQWERWDPNVVARTAWPHEIGFVQPPQPLFPSVLRDTRLGGSYHPQSDQLVPWLYTDALIQSMETSWPLRVFTVHADDGMSLTEHFFCHVLPYAPMSCRQSHEDEQAKENSIGDISGHYNQQESIFYDAITCEAANRGWIDTTKFSRHQVAVEVQKYWQEEQRRGPYDFPLLCPWKYDLDVLLHASLAKEAHIWGQAQAVAWQAAHEHAFQAAVTAHEYCAIDLNSTLLDPRWQSFFANLDSRF